MGLFSIFPESFAAVETWITRVFVCPHCCLISSSWPARSPAQLFLGIITLGPWAALLVYDLVLYIVRAVTYEIPVVGGRARGKARPRAPSLTERPTGRRRRFSLARRPEEPAQSTGGTKGDAPDARLRHTAEEKDEDLAAN
jgi:hypothetical protein